MIPTLYTATTGMIEHQLGIDVVANNLANVNTVGFKRSQVYFADILSQTIDSATAATNPLQRGTGVGTAAVNPIYSQGSVETTDRALDVMIQGSGFFVLGDPLQSGSKVYSRAGHFSFDSTNTDPGAMNLVDAATGYVVEGALDGTVGTTSVPLQFTEPPVLSPASATTLASFAGNLDADAAEKYTSIVSSPVLTSIYGHPENNGAGSYVIDSNADGSGTMYFQTGTTTLDSSQTFTALTGNPFNSLPGTYTIDVQADGAASVAFVDATGGATVTDYAAGTVVAGATDTTLIPGLDLVADATAIAGETIITVSGVSNERTKFAAGTLVAGATDSTVIPGVTMNVGTTLAGRTRIDTTGASRTGEDAAWTYIYDSAGTAHRLEIVFDRTSTNRWTYTTDITSDETFTAAGTATGETFTLANAPEPGTVEIYVEGRENPLLESMFAIAGNQIIPVDANGDGTTDSPVLPAGSSVEIRYKLAESGSSNHSGTIEFDESGVVSGGTAQPYTASLGGGNFSIAVDLSGLKQLSGSSGPFVVNVDGYATGYLEGYYVDPTGRLTAAYTNGQEQTLAQLAIATFNNPQGLLRDGDNYLRESANSGTAIIGAAAADGVGGVVIGSSLERSNVDLATELTELLTFQRGYQLNSRGVTTANEMLRTAIDLKR